MKLRTKLVLIFSLLTACSLLLISTIGYFYTNHIFTEKIIAEMDAAVTAHVNRFDGWLVGKSNGLQMTAGTLNASLGEADIQMSQLTGYKNADKDISDLYLGTPDGKIIDGSGWNPPADFDPRTRPWYKAGIQADKLTFSDPFLDGTTNEYVISAVMPLKTPSGNLRGVLSEDILLKTLVAQIKDINMHGIGYAALLDKNGLVLAHPDKEVLSKNALEVEQLKPIQNVLKQVIANEKGFISYNFNGANLMFYNKLPSTGWTLLISVPESEVYRPLVNLKLFFGLATVFLIILVIGITLLIAKRLTKPILELNEKAQLVAEGDLTIQATQNGQDEIAELSASFNKMSTNLHGLITKISSSSDHTVAAAHEMHLSANETGKTSEQIALAISDMAKGTTDQSASIQKEAAMINEMTNSIQSITKSFELCAKLADDVHNVISSGDSAMTRQKDLMAESKQASDNVGKRISLLAEHSKKIGQIVEVITGIAAQTNLLALNAAIEAARAGEQGRGFAVVAEEVRKLAEQSAQSGSEITNLVAEIQQMMAEAVQEINTTSTAVSNQEQSVNEINDYFNTIGTSVASIVTKIKDVQNSAASIESKAQNVDNIITNIAAISEGNSAGIEEIAASAEQQTATVQTIAHSAKEVVAITEQLQQEIKQFKI
ncbi:MAG: methyl-accepting chemotaxis protein [Pelosinus sp.]|nr:methyl-accepting chemotaxis protein [Pelosinus sp.]